GGGRGGGGGTGVAGVRAEVPTSPAPGHGSQAPATLLWKQGCFHHHGLHWAQSPCPHSPCCGGGALCGSEAGGKAACAAPGMPPEGRSPDCDRRAL
ncbi:unnamed protein product, partial [Discosporangium mesarthrocarpum]